MGRSLDISKSGTVARDDVLAQHDTATRARPLGGARKRVLDIVACGSMIVLLAPLMAIAACVILITQGRPILIGHTRLGHGRKPFRCLKFRSMVVNGDEVLSAHLSADPRARDEWERTRKLKNDPRITALGGFMRRTSIDELPQLFNILRGDMSLVGPRPIVEAEAEKYGVAIADYAATRPGLTGLWQVSGRSNTTYEYRVALDCAYVRNWSVRTDLDIIFRTIPSVLRSDGSY